jgi:S1-C subfamily serine protease
LNDGGGLSATSGAAVSETPGTEPGTTPEPRDEQTQFFHPVEPVATPTAPAEQAEPTQPQPVGETQPLTDAQPIGETQPINETQPLQPGPVPVHPDATWQYPTAPLGTPADAYAAYGYGQYGNAPAPYGQWQQGYGQAPYGWPPVASSQPHDHSRRKVQAVFAGVGALLLIVAAAAGGAGVDHALWHTGSTTTAGGSPTDGSGDGSGSDGSGSGLLPGSGTGTGSDGNGNGFTFPGFPGSSSGTGTGTGSTGSGSTTAQATTAQTKGVVDINTTLSYQGESAAGTGIILTSTGEVLTNNHVINGATSITATVVTTGQKYTATVVGYDKSHDIAVIQLNNASGLTTANLGDSSKVQVGDSVTGVGNAGGVGGTPSAASGSVTAVNQDVTASDEGGGSSETLHGTFKVDADIQAGDSGGPLYNSDNQVIGIDTAGAVTDASGTGGGTGFAIPINSATSIASAIENGQASETVHIGSTAFLGITVSTQDTSGSGVAIGSVLQGTAAAKAGLAEGDTITAIDGTTTNTADDVSAALEPHHPGDTIKVTWTDANGSSHSANITLGTGPAA